MVFKLTLMIKKGDEMLIKIKTKRLTSIVILCSFMSVSNAQVDLLNGTDDGWLKMNQNLEIRVDSPLAERTNALAFFIGEKDISAFVSKRAGNIYIYDAVSLSLPSGNNTLTVYDRSGDWEEIGNIELRVLTASGYSISKITPTVDVNLNSKLSDSRSGDRIEDPERETYNDLDASINFESEHEKNGLNITASANIVSTTNGAAALRFGEKQNAAPKTDLTEYIVTAVKGKTTFQVGHISQGNHPYLVDNLSHRGLTIQRRISDRLTFDLTTQSGREITGYSHILGFTTSKSQITTATLGYELLERIGGARLEISSLNGSTIAESNFDEGQVPTAEESSGFGLRLTTTSKSDKLTTDTAFARAKYNNPTDETLEFNGENLVDVKETTNNAYYSQIGYKLLNDHKLTHSLSADLSLNLRYSYIDAEYQSLAAAPNPDEEIKEFGFTGQIGPVGFQAKHTRSRDNLEDIETILTTQTSSTELAMNTSLKEIFAKRIDENSKYYKLLPSWSFSTQRVHQYNLNNPETLRSDFNDNSHLPNQVNLSFNNDLNWSFDKWDLGYQTEWSRQDNKQVGREQADFKTLGHQISISLRPTEKLNIGLAVGRIRNKDVEQDIKRYDNTYGLNLDWQLNDKLALAVSHSRNRNSDDKDLSKGISTNNELKLSYQFKVPTGSGKKLPGQSYIRYTKQSAENSDNEQDFRTKGSSSGVFAGISFSF